jgi:hypothetical protein
MAPHFDYLAYYDQDWNCPGCEEYYPRQEAFESWKFSDNVSTSLVCTTCISNEFYEAWHLDGCFPARWLGVELNPRHFRSFLTPEYIDQYFARYAQISAQHCKQESASVSWLAFTVCVTTLLFWYQGR